MVGPRVRSVPDLVTGPLPVARVQVVLSCPQSPLVVESCHVALEPVRVPPSR